MINVRTKSHTEIHFYMFDLSVFGLRLLAGASITLRSVRFMRSPKWKMEFFLFEYFLHYGLLDSLYYTIA